MEDPFSTKPSRLLHQLDEGDEEEEEEEERERNGDEDDEPINPIDLPSAPILHQSLFLNPNFDPSDFLLSRRHTALDDLRSELRAYLATLRTSLVAVINSEYEAFIGLSLGLRQASVASSLTTIRRPVVSIRNEVTRVKDELETMREEMERVLAERNAVRESKALLRRLLQMEESVEKVEGLLRLNEGSSKGNDLDRILTSPAKRLERIAGEYNQMIYLVAKAGDMPFVRSLEPRIARITSTLHLDLSQLLTSILSPPTTESPVDTKTKRESLTTILRTYASLGLTSTVEDIVRRLIVRPFTLSTIHRDVLSTPQSPIVPSTPFTSYSPSTFEGQQGSNSIISDSTIADEKDLLVPSAYIIEPVGVLNGRTAPWMAGKGPEEKEIEPLADLYNKILNFISKDCGLLLDIAERNLAVPAMALSNNDASSTGLLAMSIAASEAVSKKKIKLTNSSYEILANVIWDEVATRLMAELGHVIFAAGRPSVFHENYSLTMAFISRIESLSPNLAYLDLLRSHPTYTTFTKRFQLPVYFQLRFKEISTNVEKALEGGGPNGIVFLLAESESIWKAILQCWSEEVFLPELAARFWRLTLQLISRYRIWINGVVPKYFNSVQGTGGRTSFDSNRGNTPVPSRPSTPAPPTDEQNDESILRQLTVLIADASLMEKKVYSFYEERICTLLPSEDDVPPSENSSAVLKSSLQLITQPFIPTLSLQITTILSKRCSESLKLVRHVASQVRASTKKGQQSEPSYFIAGLLKELKVYLNGPGRVVEEELRLEWSRVVVEDLAAKYAAILASQKKTEDGLRWLKKGKGTTLSFFGRATSTTSSTPTTTAEEDDSKVKAQMQLDVNALAKDALSIGVDVEKSSIFENLQGLAMGIVQDDTSTTGGGGVKK